ncbi:MAG: Flp pilus assembly protein CpaB [Bryobacterales bacterium]|nr:Flp pilus assembly protein CpaB [Bryobacterales bacterium]
MDRRFLTVLGVSLLFALVVSSIFYQMTAKGSTKKAEKSELKDIVVAARPLGVGSTIKPDDVKTARVPADQFPKGAFSKVEEVFERPIVSNILVDEPILDGRLAARGAGIGLAPIIPVGMRAVPVRVNDVSGVAGFVLPGMRVDVLVTGHPPNYSGTITTTVLQNILVLSAGQVLQPDPRGQNINATTVTLLVNPEQAEILTLSGSEGRIQLVLRNGGDQQIQKTPGHDVAELFGLRKVRAEGDGSPKPRATRPRLPAPVVMAAPVARPAPPPPPDEVVVIRGNKKSVEIVGRQKITDTDTRP